MSKLALISRPDQGVLIDVSGCQSLAEAVEQLTATLQVSSKFWQGLAVDLNLGDLALNESELVEILSFIERVGVKPQAVISSHPQTTKLIKSRQAASAPEADLVSINDLPDAMPAKGSTTASGQAPSSVSIMQVQQSPALDLTSPCAPEAVATDTDITNSVIIDTTADRIVMIESEPDEEQSVVVAASDAGTQTPNKQGVPATLYLRQNLRSGQAISCPGNLVLIGDVNAGAEVTAGGDITVWGALRGIAHAGLGGNSEAEIRALKLDPIQIRIGNAIARSPDHSLVKESIVSGPETARLADGQIRITRSYFE
jgi:septum site-determining protein MinC